MSDNLKIYNAYRSVPEEAKKPILGGHLKNKTDINPMWRIKVLTELFGPCGTGWWYEITNKELYPGPNGEVAAVVDIDLFYRLNGDVSNAVQGTGGNTFIQGGHMDDDCFKKALTDAISVAAKALGIGADVYWEKDCTKYDVDKSVSEPQNIPAKSVNDPRLELMCKALIDSAREKGVVVGKNWDAFIQITTKLYEQKKVTSIYSHDTNQKLVWTEADMKTIAEVLNGEELPF